MLLHLTVYKTTKASDKIADTNMFVAILCHDVAKAFDSASRKRLLFELVFLDFVGSMYIFFFSNYWGVLTSKFYEECSDTFSLQKFMDLLFTFIERVFFYICKHT